MTKDHWQIWVDTGGTFTDCIGIDPHGVVHRVKILSSSHLRGTMEEILAPDQFRTNASWTNLGLSYEGFQFRPLSGEKKSVSIESISNGVVKISKGILDPEMNETGFEITSGEEAPVMAARLLTRTELKDPFPETDIKVGSTRGTNALLERKGSKVGLMITRGFGDLLPIGTQQRGHIFDLSISKPSPLHTDCIEVDERLDFEGGKLKDLDEDLSKELEQFRDHGIESIAIALMHSYRNPKHESAISELLKNEGFEYISLSSALSPSIKLLERAQTATVNAYLSPVIKNYVNKIKPFFEGNALRIMTSAGGLILADNYDAKDSLFSGPAGGVIGAALKSKHSGLDRIITFDMGGTSTDVAIYDKEYDYTFETEIDQIRIASPSLAIETVAAGGGSICSYNGFKYLVGPESSGAHPGPACYGAGGPLSITDVNLLLGWIDPGNFTIPMKVSSAQNAFEGLLNDPMSDEEKNDVLLGFREIANQKMAEAIRKISISKGNDPADYALVAFGGAGGQHACSVADQLGMKEILIPSDAGLLSAYGIGNARIERISSHQILKSLDNFKAELYGFLQEKSRQTLDLLLNEGISNDRIEIRLILLYLRFFGQDHTLEIPYVDGMDIDIEFKSRYTRLFGHWPESREIELESIRIIASTLDSDDHIEQEKVNEYLPEPTRHVSGVYDPELKPVYEINALQPGAKINGPAILLNESSTTVVDRHWELTLEANGNARILRLADLQSDQPDTKPEALQLELFTNRFRSLADDMGALLQRTSFSVNIKERLDFSCALLDPNGELIVNAPHIPVHLGGMGICVRAVMNSLELEEGDVVITNHPGHGGSHLPDITIIAPVYHQGKLAGFVANRAHHAELGGKKPGSMPPDARNLEEEGVVIAPMYLVKRHEANWGAIETLLSSGPYPTRSIHENLADLNAALASVRLGAERLESLCDRFGFNEVQKYMLKLKEYASNALGEALIPYLGKNYVAEEYLDDGNRIKAEIQIEEAGVRISFEGTSHAHPGNYNATRAIVHSAVIYVLRLLVVENIPLNEGLMEKVSIELPVCFINPDFPEDPKMCPAVVGGNTETSQRIVDTLLKALGIAGCSQGTMNNFLFGNENFGYYETIAGGTGATEGVNGADAVHQHMTNTRITDPEILELRYPVRLEEFSIRKNSGGQGQWRGGDGIIRKFRFLEELEITMLSQHRKEAPYGMEGGEAGWTGKQVLIRKDGEETELDGTFTTRVYPDDQLVIYTPGGGAFGK